MPCARFPNLESILLNINRGQGGNWSAGRLPANIRDNRCATQEEQIYDIVINCSFCEIMAGVPKQESLPEFQRYENRERFIKSCTFGLILQRCYVLLSTADNKIHAAWSSFAKQWVQKGNGVNRIGESNLTAKLLFWQEQIVVSVQKVLLSALNEFIGNQYPFLVHWHVTLRPWPERNPETAELSGSVRIGSCLFIVRQTGMPAFTWGEGKVGNEKEAPLL